MSFGQSKLECAAQHKTHIVFQALCIETTNLTFLFEYVGYVSLKYIFKNYFDLLLFKCGYYQIWNPMEHTLVLHVIFLSDSGSLSETSREHDSTIKRMAGIGCGGGEEDFLN